MQMQGTLRGTLRETHEANQADKIIHMQKDEIRRLRQSLRELELRPSRPSSQQGALPPMPAGI